MAFVIPFWTFISLVSDFGLSNAIVREQKLTRRQAGAAVNLCLLITVAGAAGMVALAWPISRVMNDYKIAEAMACFALVLSLAMISTIPRAMLERELKYRTLAIIESVATLGALPLCFALAVSGAGFWSLIAYHVAVQVIRLIGFGRYGRHNIELTRGWREALPLAKFGGWVLAYNLQNFLARNADNIIIGLYLGASALGVYAISYQIMILPLMTVTWPASGVLLATVSRLQNDLLKAQQYVACLISLTAALIFPAMIYLTFGSKYPLTVYMTAAWRDVPDLLFWLAWVGAIQSVAAYGGAVLTAQGKMRLYLSLGVANTVVFLIIFLITARIGIQTLVMSYAVAAIIGSLVYLGTLARVLEVSVVRLASWMSAGLLATGLGLAAVGLSRLVQVQDAGLRWALETGAYSVAVVAVLLFFRVQLVGQVRLLAASRGISDVTA
jgi:O-antigen/teichoic acid export membrane protein